MIGLPDHVRVYLYTQPVDFRKGFDGLTGIVTTALGQNVTNGSLFLFVNRRGIVSRRCGGRLAA
jgi:transposase